MGLRVGVGAAALAGVLVSGFAVVPVQRVEAQGLFQGMFGAPVFREWQREWAPRYRQPRARRPAREQRAAPRVYVSGPKYYTYEPDALQTVSLARLAEIEIATAGPLGPSFEDGAFARARGALAEVNIRALPEVGEAILAHYARYPELLWVEDGRVGTRALAVIAALGRAERFGLAPEDYLVEVPLGFAGDPAGRQRALVEFEMALSARVLTYVLDATRGRIDPNRISGYHDFARKEVDLGEALVMLAAAPDPEAWLESRHPDHRPFRALVEELERLRLEDGGERVEIAEGTFLKPGASSPELANVVAAIRLVASETLKGGHAATLAAYEGGAEYTPELVSLVRGFQEESGLQVDGIVGRNTIGALTPETVADKIAKVELAMERLRWLPRDLGARHVFINQPAYTATYVEAGRAALEMRAVVGQKDNQTYFFSDRAEIVEYNPYWGVPRSIIVNEMVPRLYSDPSYLDRLGYEVTTASGKRVSSRSVNWGGVASKRVAINVRQPPGPRNALGAVKILFPNKHAIYMHDTPHKELFAKPTRAFSHGCVRLQEPRAMAAAVLGKSVDYIDARIAEGRNARDPVSAEVPVHVAYFTAWPSRAGAVEYFDDVYERDQYLTKAIERTRAARHAEG